MKTNRGRGEEREEEEEEEDPTYVGDDEAIDVCFQVEELSILLVILQTKENHSHDACPAYIN